MASLLLQNQRAPQDQVHHQTPQSPTGLDSLDQILRSCAVCSIADEHYKSRSVPQCHTHMLSHIDPVKHCVVYKISSELFSPHGNDVQKKWWRSNHMSHEKHYKVHKYCGVWVSKNAVHSQ